jgi:hypothetical protein
VWPDLPRGQAVFAPIEVITDENSIAQLFCRRTELAEH